MTYLVTHTPYDGDPRRQQWWLGLMFRAKSDTASPHPAELQQANSIVSSQVAPMLMFSTWDLKMLTIDLLKKN